MLKTVKFIKTTVVLTVLLSVALTALWSSSPRAVSAAEQAPGTCFITDSGNIRTTKPCMSLKWDANQKDSGGTPIDPNGCYEVDQTVTPPSIIRVNCDDTAIVDPAATSGNCKDIQKCDLITKYINPLVNLLSALVGVAVVISIIIGGIQYSQSAGDPQKAAMARNRIRNAILALIAFIFLYAMLNFLIPGGLV